MRCPRSSTNPAGTYGSTPSSHDTSSQDAMGWDVGNQGLVLSSSFELEANIDEVIRRPRPCVLESQLVEARRDLLDALVERRLLVAQDEECRVHDHLVADRPVDARRHGDVAKPLKELGDVSLRPLLQRAVDQ